MAASKKTRQAISLSLLVLALILIIVTFTQFGDRGSSRDPSGERATEESATEPGVTQQSATATARLYAAGGRGAFGSQPAASGATAVPTPIPSVGVTDTGAIIVPVRPEDDGVVITIAPTATPGVRIAAAPAVPGLPIVVGIRDGQFLSPEALRAGEQTFEVVNQHDQPHRFAVLAMERLDDAPRSADGTLDEAALGDALLGVSEPIEPARSLTLTVTMAPGPHLLVSNVLVSGEPAVDAGYALPVEVVGEAVTTDG